MKIRSSLASALLLAAPVVTLISGCGGGSTNSPFPTPTAFPTNTPVPTETPAGGFAVTSESNDGSSFGPENFSSVTGVAAQTSSLYTVTFTDAQGRTVRFEIANPSTFNPDNLGKTYSLTNSGTNIGTTALATVPASGTTPQTSWGGPGYSQGRLRLVGFSGNRYSFEMQDVVLSRRPATSGSTTGSSQLKLTGSFNIYLLAN